MAGNEKALPPAPLTDFDALMKAAQDMDPKIFLTATQMKMREEMLRQNAKAMRHANAYSLGTSGMMGGDTAIVDQGVSYRTQSQFGRKWFRTDPMIGAVNAVKRRTGLDRMLRLRKWLLNVRPKLMGPALVAGGLATPCLMLVLWAVYLPNWGVHPVVPLALGVGISASVTAWALMIAMLFELKDRDTGMRVRYKMETGKDFRVADEPDMAVPWPGGSVGGGVVGVDMAAGQQARVGEVRHPHLAPGGGLRPQRGGDVAGGTAARDHRLPSPGEGDRSLRHLRPVLDGERTAPHHRLPEARDEAP